MTITIAHVDSVLTGKRRPVPKLKAEPKPKPPKKVREKKPKPEPRPRGITRAPFTVGIYAVRHIETGQAYIGMSREPWKRLAAHRADLKADRHVTPKLQNLWEEGAFVFEVLEVDIDGNFAQAREQFWMWRFEGRLLNATEYAWPDMAPGFREGLLRGNKSRPYVKCDQVAGPMPSRFCVDAQ